VSADNPTWLVYVAVLLLAVFFRFSRIFSIRNLDIILILMLSTALVISGSWKDREYNPATASADTAQNEAASAETDAIDSGASIAVEVDESGAVSTSTDSNQPSDEQDPVSSLASADPALTNPASAETGGGDDAASEAELISDTAAPPQNTAGMHPVYRWSSIVLITLSALLMIRLVFDEALTRRPRLEQNLNQAGMMFLCLPAYTLLAVSVFVVNPPTSTVNAVVHGSALLERREVAETTESEEIPPAPTETLLGAGAAGVAQLSENLVRRTSEQETLAQVLVVISHFIVVSGLVYIGKQHFGSLQLGLSMCCLYLLLPCTAYNVHQLNHVLPAACLTWAVACYRRPAMAGALLGLACGTLFFAVFLLPLWAVFYGKRGSLRFGTSLLGVAVVLIVCMMMTSSDTTSFLHKLVTSTNWTVYRLLDDSASFSTPGLGHVFLRIPMAALFFVMLTAMTVLPRPRNLESLLANSTALVVAAQLWYPEDIGTYVLWYLPLLLLVVFRPRLDRFVPPEILDRKKAAISPPPRKASSPAAAANRMSRMNFYR